MNLVHIVGLLAVAQYFLFGIFVGRARAKYGVKAPAVTGHEGFERAFRVQMNTLEQLAGFLPSMFIASQYWSSQLVAAIGALYLIGRFVYWRTYIANPARRQLGFILTVTPTFAFLGLGLVGAIAAH